MSLKKCSGMFLTFSAKNARIHPFRTRIIRVSFLKAGYMMQQKSLVAFTNCVYETVEDHAQTSWVCYIIL